MTARDVSSEQGPPGGVWTLLPPIRLPTVARRKRLTNGHAEIVWDDPDRPGWAHCTWCHAQSRGDGKHGGELAKPRRTWRRCDLVTREETHSGEVAHPDYPSLGRDLDDGRWLCPRCVADGRTS